MKCAVSLEEGERYYFKPESCKRNETGKRKSPKSWGIISRVLFITFLGKCSLAVHLAALVKQAFLCLPTVMLNTESLSSFPLHSAPVWLACCSGKLERSGGYLWQNCQIEFILIPVPSSRDPIFIVKYTAHKHWFSKPLWQQIINIK